MGHRPRRLWSFRPVSSGWGIYQGARMLLPFCLLSVCVHIIRPFRLQNAGNLWKVRGNVCPARYFSINYPNFSPKIYPLMEKPPK